MNMREKQKNFDFAMLTYFLIVIFFVTLRLLSSFGLLSFMGDYGDYVFTIFVQIILLFGGSIFLFSSLKKQKISKTFLDFGVNRVSWKVIGLSLILGFVVYFINLFVSSTFNGIIDLFGYEHNYGSAITSYSFSSLIINIFFTAILPGICEEIAHRGMLFKAFRPFGTWRAIWISALLFGLLHVNIEQFFYATLIGVFLGFLTLISNSIIPAMIVHFMNNALSCYVIFSSVNGLPLGNAIAWFEGVINSNIFVGILVSILVLISLFYLLIFVTQHIARLRIKEDLADIQMIFNKEIIRQNYLFDLEKTKSELSGQQFDPTYDLENDNLYDPFLKIKEFVFSQDLQTEETFKPSKYGKLLLFGSFLLMSVLTLFTFVWGVL